MSSYPTNPVLGPDHKPELGRTRVQYGSLEWFDSHTNTWSKSDDNSVFHTFTNNFQAPAVRQHTIRDKLIRQASRLGSYSKSTFSEKYLYGADRNRASKRRKRQ